MIIPCIDLMDGKVVQLVQGREKALERTIDEMLEAFAGFPQLQVIDLDAAMGGGSNRNLLREIAARTAIRAGGGVRTVDIARELIKDGAYRVIVGTAAFSVNGPDIVFLEKLNAAIGRERLTIALDSRGGRIVIKGWRESTGLVATELVSELEPYCSGFLCTYVDKEGMMQGTDVGWFTTLRRATRNELIAAGGITTMDDVRALTDLDVHCAIGMSIYTGRLSLEKLRSVNEVSHEN